MKDNSKQITLLDIAMAVKGILDDSLRGKIISQAGSLGSDFTSTTIGWCSDDNIALLDMVETGAILVSKAVYTLRSGNHSGPMLVGVDNPRRAFAMILSAFFVEDNKWGSIAASASIDKSVLFDNDKVNIGHNVVIEADVSIGDYVIVGHNSVIKSRTEIKHNVRIGSNCTIGAVGFGYEMSEDGLYEVIPHIGNVVLERNVEIGNNVCIDRAVLGSTFLDENVKIDNLVHISHGVSIGKNSLVIAHAMIAGSVQVGEGVWIAPCSAIRQKLKIADNALVGLGSVVVKDVEAGDTVAGVPARSLSKTK